MTGAGIVARRKFVYVSTNALLLSKHIGEYRPPPYLRISFERAVGCHNYVFCTWFRRITFDRSRSERGTGYWRSARVDAALSLAKERARFHTTWGDSPVGRE